MNQAKVLVIEDLRERFVQLEREMRGKNVELIPAATEEEARKRIRQITSKELFIDAAVVNACLGTHDLQVSSSLVRALLGSFRGPIIGTSNTTAYQTRLKEAGCQQTCDYDSLAPMLVQVLGL